MAKAPKDEAKKLYQQGLKLIDIAEKLDIPVGTIRSWKSRQNWDEGNGGATLQKGKRNVAKKRKVGGQPGNKNAVGNGAPEENKNAERHGFFAKWLPEETAQIMQKLESSNPIDLLWDNIQLQYTAIIRAQKLMYVKDQQDITTTKIGEGCSDSGSSEKWEVQQAWDKHANFMNAQSRAMKTLESMIKNYEELINKNQDLVTEEQKLRVDKLKQEISQNEPTDEVVRIIDDI